MMSFTVEVGKEAYENYFRIADLNGDGKINGTEAVAFFRGSNLSQEVLAQIWSYADGENRGFLDRLGFYNALKLVSVAQTRGRLTPESIKYALSATSKVQAPKIEMAKTKCFLDSREADVLEWPKFSESDISKYAEIFRIMDRDKYGKITGQQAHNLFLSWKIPKGILKDIWTLSDYDGDGNLSFVEFCIAVYLMERQREGFSLPTSLPDTVKYDKILLKAASKDQEDEDLEKAIKASIQTAIHEGISVFLPCDSFEGTKLQSPGPSTPTVANYIPTLSTTSAPSAPPLDSLSTESFFCQSHVQDFGTTRLKPNEMEEWNNSNINLGVCSICIEEPVEGACIPCGHMAGCMGCLQKIKSSSGECPICRCKIAWIVELYSV